MDIKIKEQWQPKVGEECLVKHNGDWHETFIVGISSHGSYVYESSKFAETMYDGNNINCFKPLPTEEEKLIDEFVNDYRYIAYPSDSTFEQKVNIIAKNMLNKGYRKIEPIDYSKFHDVCNNPTDVFDWLIANNHIIVKGE